MANNFELLRNYYRKHNPEMVPKVGAILNKNRGKEKALFATISRKYKDPITPIGIEITSSDTDPETDSDNEGGAGPPPGTPPPVKASPKTVEGVAVKETKEEKDRRIAEGQQEDMAVALLKTKRKQGSAMDKHGILDKVLDDYVREKDLKGIFPPIMQDLLVARPDDAIKFIIESLYKKYPDNPGWKDMAAEIVDNLYA